MTLELVTSEPQRLATGFHVTEGPLWHPDGWWYFVDRRSRLYRLAGRNEVEVVRTTEGGNGTTFDLNGNLIMCEGRGRKVTRMNADGSVVTIADRFAGGRLNKPNDVVCRSDGSLFFTDPDKRIPYRDREIPGGDGDDGVWDGASVYRIAPDGSVHRVALCEYPNGLAFSPDERTLYVANTRSSQYLHALTIDEGGSVVSRSIFADMNRGTEPGIPDGVKVDAEGRVYCTGSGGIWVFDSNGEQVVLIRFPERAVNFAFGGPDLQTLFCCTESSVYSVGVRVPGNPHPWYVRAGISGA